MNILLQFFRRETPEDQKLRESLKTILGINPNKINIYKQALRHDSSAIVIYKNGLKNNNERLEFLGDAVLSAVVAEMVFLNYPYRNEGFLTQMRAKLVSRDMLNQLAKKTGIHQLLMYERKGFSHPNGLEIAYGNAMEALIGAIFLDKGYRVTKKYIIQNLIANHVDIEKLEESDDNFKSKLYEWAQGNGMKIVFDEAEIISNGKYQLRRIVVSVNGEPLAEAKDHVKKKAEQEAARLACEKLGIKDRN